MEIDEINHVFDKQTYDSKEFEVSNIMLQSIIALTDRLRVYLTPRTLTVPMVLLDTFVHLPVP